LPTAFIEIIRKNTLNTFRARRSPRLHRHVRLRQTYNAGTAIERLLARQGARVVIIDPLGVWWGLRLLADGKKPSASTS
jgi:hypothetical protein